ncbi:MAG TPA: hypothetical protein VGE77_05260 [Nocardioides sp.]
MLRVTLRGAGLPTVTLGSGETLFFGRSPDRAVPDESPENALRITAIALPRCAPHVSRVLGELIVGEEIARLRWHGSGETQVSSLFDAPGGARRVTVTEGMSLLLDEGDNQLVVMRGRLAGDTYDDLSVSIEVTPSGSGPVVAMPRPGVDDVDDGATAPAPRLPHQSREWYVALALAEPWLSGTDDYPRPPSNREIYERVLHWHGYAWNLERAQRVDDAIRSISALAFGPKDDPFRAGSGRAQNVRFAIGRRTAEVRLVTTDDLEEVERAAARRNVPPARA